MLVVLLAGGVAVIRSMNTSLFAAGNIAFKRDLVNQGEQALSKVTTDFKAGGPLAATSTLATNVPASNYSAVQLVANASGIPNVLLTTGAASGADISGATFTPTGADMSGVLAGTSGAASGITIRYVIDRLCNATGAASIGKCAYTPSSGDVAGGSSQLPASKRPLTTLLAVYRVSVRITGPRGTQVFLQSSFTKPE
ncbi:hypothetical protein [Variovorax sp. PAMC 28711]|uniref:hypothetical protein n=1 Tax=Variovorax sp. PAMC 28711 TaxID=1795631 RepID=UPI0012E990F0|nr:hypothetical protein [Variovorax sp. PAMC 28711]